MSLPVLNEGPRADDREPEIHSHFTSEVQRNLDPLILKDTENCIIEWLLSESVFATARNERWKKRLYFQTIKHFIGSAVFCILGLFEKMKVCIEILL